MRHIKNRWFFFSFLGFFCLLSDVSSAQIVVKDYALSFLPKDNLIKTFPVGNSSEDQSFVVKANVYKVVETRPEEKLVKTQDLLVIPKEMHLAPRRSQLARVLIKQRPIEKDAVYRIQFIPHIKRFGLGQESNEEALSGEISLLSGAGVLLWVSPENPEVKYDTEWNETGVKITNTGNTNIILRQETGCVEGMSCTIDGVRLWAGESWQLNVPESLRHEEILLEMRALNKISTIKVTADE